MKKYFIKFSFYVAMILFSCEKDYLEEPKPTGTVNSDVIFQSKEIKKSESKNNYYKSSDFENFDKLKKFLIFNDNKSISNKNESIKTITNYTDNDKNEFDQIIKLSSNKKNYKMKKIDSKFDNKKIKIIDFDKLNNKEKNFKNKMGIEKIKIVYFD